jgi:hypothetical protein
MEFNMKKLILFLLFSVLAYSQQEPAYQVEFFFGTENNYGSPPTVYLSAVSYVWKVDFPPPSTNCENLIFELTNEYDNLSYTPPLNNQSINNWGGFEFVTSQNTAGADVFGYGLYKITCEGLTFYLDYRDERISCPSYGTVGHWIDFWLMYNGAGELWYYHGFGSDWTEVDHGEYIALWDLKSAGTQHTDDLEYYWTHSLAIIPSSPNGHPKLIWGPYPDAGTLNGNIVEYKIYKSNAHVPGYDPSGFFYLDSVDPTEYWYIDYTEEIGNGMNAKSYYVTALVEYISEVIGETGATNVFEIELAPPSKAVAENFTAANYDLLQNYPNPFNPSTNIYFSLLEDDFVQLSVYNLLGEEIQTLINGYTPAGRHSVTFNADGLPSGTYFYRIKEFERFDYKKYEYS